MPNPWKSQHLRPAVELAPSLFLCPPRAWRNQVTPNQVVAGRQSHSPAPGILLHTVIISIFSLSVCAPNAIPLPKVHISPCLHGINHLPCTDHSNLLAPSLRAQTLPAFSAEPEFCGPYASRLLLTPPSLVSSGIRCPVGKRQAVDHIHSRLCPVISELVYQRR